MLWALAAAGMAVRWAHVFVTRAEPPHTDFASFANPALTMAHPYDTSFREPAFVWWLRLLGGLGVHSHPWVRAFTALWFVPVFFMAAEIADRSAGGKVSLAAAVLYAFLPAQVHADGLALRHGLEAFGVALLVRTLLRSPDLKDRGPWARAAGAAALLTLTRINFLASAALLLGWRALRGRSLRPLAALLPAVLLLLPHLWNNHRRFGDAFYSVNYHSYWFGNLEDIGKPGGPASYEDWHKDPYRKSRNFLDWRFKGRPLLSLARDLAVGLPRSLAVFYREVYFEEDLPASATWALLGLYALGFAAALRDPAGRTVTEALIAFSLPYALVIHVFWAGRFFVPFTPLVLALTALGAASIGRLASFRRTTRPS
jgi:hypothetical protein